MPSQTPSPAFTLNLRDIARSILMAILAALVIALAGIAQTPGFDLFTADWGMIGHNMLNVGFTALIAYLAKNYFSDSSGKAFGRI